MEKYNYREAIKDDIRTYISEHDVRFTADEREDVKEQLYDNMWMSDQVTGNASGSYTFNAWQSEEYICHNMDLLADAIFEFGADAGTYKNCLESAETADVTIRCYLLSECLEAVLDEMELELEDEDDDENRMSGDK